MAYPKWINKLQENSWELELLISGGAIFSLFQLSDLLLDFALTWGITSSVPGLSVLLIAAMYGVKCLTIGFAFHLFCRAVWIGLVCIDYVTNNNGENENSKLKDLILKVDKISGKGIFLSVISIVIILGILICFSLLVILPVIVFGQGSVAMSIYLKVISVVLLIYTLDVLFFGVVRKLKFLNPVFKVLDFISFRFFVQEGLTVYNAYESKLKRFIILSFFMFLALLFTYSSLYRVMHWPNIIENRDLKWKLSETFMSYNHYRDENGNHKIQQASIQSKIITESCVDLFIVYRKTYDFYIDEKYFLEEDFYFTDAIELQIDGQKIEGNLWFTKTNPEIDQWGMETLIDIDSLELGNHVLTVLLKEKYLNKNLSEDDLNNGKIVIPFFKAREN